MKKVTQSSQEFGIDIDIKKTKYMVVSNIIPQGQLVIDEKSLEKVKTFTYLGGINKDWWDHALETKFRIEMQENVFNIYGIV